MGQRIELAFCAIVFPNYSECKRRNPFGGTIKSSFKGLNMSDILDFNYFNEELLNMGAISSAAELQGMLCGKVCGSGLAEQELPDDWMLEMQRFMDMEFLQLSSDQAALIVELYELTLQNLDDSDFRFRPLLPGEGASMQRRSEELAAWCRGYLHGIGTSGLQATDQLSADVADAIRDMAKISQVEIDPEETNQEKLETDWEGLVEYVKVAVLNVREELRIRKPDSDESDSMVH